MVIFGFSGFFNGGQFDVPVWAGGGEFEFRRGDGGVDFDVGPVAGGDLSGEVFIPKSHGEGGFSVDP